MVERLDFETAEAGSPIDGISIPALTRVTLARFAGAAEDYNALHLDDKVAQTFGKNSVYAHSTLVMSYMGRMAQDALHGTSIRRFGVRVLKLLWPGDVLTCVIVNPVEGTEVHLSAAVELRTLGLDPKHDAVDDPPVIGNFYYQQDLSKAPHRTYVPASED